MATRRYTHSEPYLRRMAAMYGFEEVSLTPSALRVERGQPVPGYVVVLRLPRECGACPREVAVTAARDQPIRASRNSVPTWRRRVRNLQHDLTGSQDMAQPI